MALILPGGLGGHPSPPDPNDHILTAAAIQERTAGIVLPDRLLAAGLGPTLNQGSLPQCTAYAEAGLKMWEEKADLHGVVRYDTGLFYSWEKLVDGILGAGSTGRAAMQVAYKRGYPVLGHPEQAASNKIAGYWSVPVSDIDTMRAAILGFGPIITGAEWPFSFFHPIRGIVPKPAGGIAGGHETLRIGWDMHLPGVGPAWLIRNSWGKYKGSTGGGNFWLPMAYESSNGKAGTATIWEAWKAKDILHD